jgi:hypothetical protein
MSSSRANLYGFSVQASRIGFALTLVGITVGCSRDRVRPAHLQVDAAKLQSITDACHVPASWLRHEDPRFLVIQPDPDAKYDDVHCVLKELEAAHLPLRVGFVGNEAYEPETNDAPPH